MVMLWIEPEYLLYLIPLLIWDLVWKLKAMWKAAKNNSVPWFVLLAIMNTLGILPILYLYVFSPQKKNREKTEYTKKKQKKKGKIIAYLF